MTALISLVMTTYNREQYLAIAIESVLRQTHREFELLIWDDGSSDDSVAIAQQYALQDSRVRVVAAQHLGRGLALKGAIAQTTGDYMGWLDDDDILAATALAETGALLDALPQVGMTYTSYAYIDRAGRFKGRGRRCQIPYTKEGLLLDFITFHFRLIRRSIFNQAGGVDPAFESIEDYELCLRLSEITDVRHIPQFLYSYRIHGNTISTRERQHQTVLAQTAIYQAQQRRGLALMA